MSRAESVTDMSPQGLADAIADLTRDLPQRKTKPDDSWQRVLALQLLNTALDQPAAPESPTDADHDAASAAWSFRASFVANIERVIRRQPALFHALVTAFDLERRGWTDPTPFAETMFGTMLRVALDDVWKERYGEMHPPAASDEGGQP